MIIKPKFEKDKYYAPNFIVNTIIQLIKANIDLSNIDEIIEPSAGNGAFIDNLKTLKKPCVFLDLYPDHPDVKQQDFLEWKIKDNKTRAFIGGPPFSKNTETQSSLYYLFLDICEKNNAEIIAFISPMSAYNNNYFKKDYRLIFSESFGKVKFLNNNKTQQQSIPVCFNIWKKEIGYTKRNPKILQLQKDFNIKTCNSRWNVKKYSYYIRMHGRAGEIVENINDKYDHIGITLLNLSLISKFNKIINNFYYKHFNFIRTHSTRHPYMNKERFMDLLVNDMYE